MGKAQKKGTRRLLGMPLSDRIANSGNGGVKEFLHRTDSVAPGDVRVVTVTGKSGDVYGHKITPELLDDGKLMVRIGYHPSLPMRTGPVDGDVLRFVDRLANTHGKEYRRLAGWRHVGDGGAEAFYEAGV